jgi:hypothetical protein
VFEVIQGDAGFVTVAAGAKAGIISRWNITRSGLKPDGTPRLRFRAQFSWVNDTLMGLKMQKRVVVQMRTKYGVESVDILVWDEAKFEGGVLTLENVLYAELKKREIAH